MSFGDPLGGAYTASLENHSSHENHKKKEGSTRVSMEVIVTT